MHRRIADQTKRPPMNEQTPYVVDNRWIVYAKSTMEATLKYRNEYAPNKWPVVRQATPDDLARLTPLVTADYRQSAESTNRGGSAAARRRGPARTTPTRRPHPPADNISGSRSGSPRRTPTAPADTTDRARSPRRRGAPRSSLRSRPGA